jgi:hypothetical protein
VNIPAQRLDGCEDLVPDLLEPRQVRFRRVELEYDRIALVGLQASRALNLNDSGVGRGQLAGRVAPVFGGCIWLACSRRVVVLPDVLGGTGSDCAGAASFPGCRDVSGWSGGCGQGA